MSTSTNPLAPVERATEAYASARDQLSELVRALQAGIDALKAEAIPEIRAAIRRATTQHDRLKALIESQPELFTRPRSQTFHGIRVGYQKSKGRLVIENPEQTIKLIRRHFPEQADVLIATTESPVRTALNGIAAADLKKLGVTITGAGDAVLIKPVDDEIDKMVDALLDAATDKGDANG
jgi:hypothetical protein